MRPFTTSRAGCRRPGGPGPKGAARAHSSSARSDKQRSPLRPGAIAPRVGLAERRISSGTMIGLVTRRGQWG